jgi:hypothetical protein
MDDAHDAHGGAAGLRATARTRITDTDRAILVALCQPYVVGGGLPSPASNKAILAELCESGIYLSFDALRTHLRGLYAKFGVEDGLTGMQKRVRLVELTYDSAIVPGWGEGQAAGSDASGGSSQEPEPAGPGTASKKPWLSRVCGRRPVIAALLLVAAVVVTLVVVARPSTRPSANERATRQALTDFTTRDLVGLRRILADDVTLIEPNGRGGTEPSFGIDAAMMRMSKLRSYFGKRMRYQITDLDLHGDSAEYGVSFTGRQVKDFPNGVSRNDTAGIAMVTGRIRSTFADGRITEIHLRLYDISPVDGTAQTAAR